MITVFTPTYNRAFTLPNLYKSLKSQTCQDFEWLIIDDGSTDGTRDMVNGWEEENSFAVRYYYQENGGKHCAINKGAQLANGDWFFIVDSDDLLPNNSLEIAYKWIKTIDGIDKFAAICGVKHDISGEIQSDYIFDFIDVSPIKRSTVSRKEGAAVYKTKILQHYPFPVFEGEKYCAESLIWNRIGRNYKNRYFNEVIYHYEYLDDGLTHNSLKNRRNSPSYATLNYKEQLLYMHSKIDKIRGAINYWRFVWLTKRCDFFEGLPCWVFFFLPFGIALYCKDSICLYLFSDKKYAKI